MEFKNNTKLKSKKSSLWYNFLPDENILNDQIEILRHWETYIPFCLLGIKLDWEFFVGLVTGAVTQFALLVGSLQNVPAELRSDWNATNT